MHALVPTSLSGAHAASADPTVRGRQPPDALEARIEQLEAEIAALKANAKSLCHSLRRRQAAGGAGHAGRRQRRRRSRSATSAG